MKKTYPPRISPDHFLYNDKKLTAVKKNMSKFFLHWHDFFEIEFILTGNGAQLLNGQEYSMSCGAAYLLSPTDFHEITSCTDIEAYSIIFKENIISEELLNRIINTKENIICTLTEKNHEKLLNLCRLLELDDNSNESYTKNLIDCVIMLILENTKEDKQRKSSENTRNMIVYKASLYMRIHFRENPSLSDISKYLCLNESYFCKLFHSEMNITPKRYMAQLKLDYAKKLLICTDLTVTEVCFACGYTSIPNFLRAFRERHNVTPSELRHE